jgi:hypothetical protein
MHFEEQYPNKPPGVKFISQMFHPNVYGTGELCLDILQNRWSPTYDVAAILTSIQRYGHSNLTTIAVFEISSWNRADQRTVAYSTTQTHHRRRMWRRVTCTRTIGKSIPSGCGRRLRRAGKTESMGGKGTISYEGWSIFAFVTGRPYIEA